MRSMLANGVKRKLAEDEEAVDVAVRPPVAAALQRQAVLNVSLMKLYGPRGAASLRLQRRVLINNLVRRIHDDLRHEGAVGTLFFSAAPPLAAAAREDDSYQQPPPPPAPPASFVLSGLTALDSCLTPASLLEEDLPMFFTLPPSSSSSSSSSSQHHLHHSSRSPPPPKDSFSSALEEIEELCPSSSSPSSSSPPPAPPLPPPPHPPPPAPVLTDVVMKEEEGQDLQEVEEAPPPPPPSSSSGSFLTDFALDDVLFTDIDTSMYDLGPPPSKMAPAVTAPGAQNQPFKLDLAELDHIMEVLVGS